MELWYAIITTCGTTLAGALVADIIVRVKTSGKKYINRRKAEQRGEIIDIFTEATRPLKDDLNKVNEQLDDLIRTDLHILKKANRDSIRTQLYEIYDRCELYKTTNDIETESELFDSYKALMGNHGCDARHDRFIKLPIKEELNVSSQQPSKKRQEK